MITTDWTPRYLGRALFEQGQEWITADGRRKQITEMDDNHLLNTTLMLEGLVEQIHSEIGDYRHHSREWLNSQPLYQALKREIHGRMSARHEAKTLSYDDLLEECYARAVLRPPSDAKILREVEGRGLVNRVINSASSAVLLAEIERRLRQCS